VADAAGQVRRQARLHLRQHPRLQQLDGVPEAAQLSGEPLDLGQAGVVGGQRQQRGRVRTERDRGLLRQPPVAGHALPVQAVGDRVGVGEQQAAVAARGARRQAGPLQHQHLEAAVGQRVRARAADDPPTDDDHVAGGVAHPRCRAIASRALLTSSR
jgi:hypothetical protein